MPARNRPHPAPAVIGPSYTLLESSERDGPLGVAQGPHVPADERKRGACFNLTTTQTALPRHRCPVTVTSLSGHTALEQGWKTEIQLEGAFEFDMQHRHSLPTFSARQSSTVRGVGVEGRI